METPFKFLDAYTRKDRDIFFGRDKEIDALYEMVFKTPLIMVYGPSGAGKTSLIRCGLASCFDGPDWYPFFIRRGDDINETIRRQLEEAIGEEDQLEEYSLPGAVRQLFRLELRPVYLIFDQFEELLLLGREEEKNEFYDNVNALLQEKLSFKLIFVIREEFLGHLYEFEKKTPTVRDFRLRVEPMTRKNARQVIKGTTEKLGIEIENPEETITAILDNISEKKSGVQLAHLQIYLDRLYQEAVQD